MRVIGRSPQEGPGGTTARFYALVRHPPARPACHPKHRFPPILRPSACASGGRPGVRGRRTRPAGRSGCAGRAGRSSTPGSSSASAVTSAHRSGRRHRYPRIRPMQCRIPAKSACGTATSASWKTTRACGSSARSSPRHDWLRRTCALQRRLGSLTLVEASAQSSCIDPDQHMPRRHVPAGFDVRAASARHRCAPPAGQGSRMSVADDELEHVVVVPGGLLAPAA